MAVKINGMFRHPLTKQLYDSPVLVLYPVLHYKDSVNMKVEIIEQSSGVMFFNDIDKNGLNYEPNDNHFNGLISALEDYIISQLDNQTNCEFIKGYVLPEINNNNEEE